MRIQALASHSRDICSCSPECGSSSLSDDVGKCKNLRSGIISRALISKILTNEHGCGSGVEKIG